MWEILHAGSPSRDDSTQHPLPLDQRQIAQVPAIEPQAVERHEAGVAAAVEERIEQRAAIPIQTDDLAVEDHVLDAPEGACDLGGERGEALEGVTVARDETTLTVLDVGESPKPVELEFKEPVAMVEGFAASV
jgi:hypothetical protein